MPFLLPFLQSRQDQAQLCWRLKRFADVFVRENSLSISAEVMASRRVIADLVSATNVPHVMSLGVVYEAEPLGLSIACDAMQRIRASLFLSTH